MAAASRGRFRFVRSGKPARCSEHLDGQGFVGAVLRRVGVGRVVQHIAQHQHFGHIQHRHLDGDAAGVQRALLRAALQHDVRQLRAGRVLIVGQQNESSELLRLRVQKLEHQLVPFTLELIAKDVLSLDKDVISDNLALPYRLWLSDY